MSGFASKDSLLLFEQLVFFFFFSFSDLNYLQSTFTPCASVSAANHPLRQESVHSVNNLSGAITVLGTENILVN